MTEQSQLHHDDIMIVDDNPVNLQLLEEMLHQQTYEVRSFPLGRLALAAAIKHPPDLILLDVNMPEMNGYEVCERLKATEQLSSIPVMFLSALDRTEDKVKAFHAGAADYISKPFQLEEVQARVKTQLGLHSLQKALEHHNRKLEDTVVSRTRELARVNERLKIMDRSKNDFLSLISHEFRTPLNGILGIGDLLFEDKSLKPETKRLQLMFQSCRRRILTILDDALLLTEIDVSGHRFSASPVRLSTAVASAIGQTFDFSETRHVTLIKPPDDLVMVAGDVDLLAKALHALLETAVKFSKDGGVIPILRDDAADTVSIIIEARGRSIPESSLVKFFDLLAVGEAIIPGGDLGLGPAVACRILALFGASVSVANLATPGIRLTILLKAAEAEPEDD